MGYSSLVHYPRVNWSLDKSRDRGLEVSPSNDSESHSVLGKGIHRWVEGWSIDMVRLVNVRTVGSSPSLCVVR